MIEEARNTALANDNRAHSNGESRKDKCSNSMITVEGRVGATQPICYGNK